ncbi:hypothetical protein [Phenylobacterium soli]|uniref:Uncharacterized protein n=1 Tax=Phenylobacterium soli TaxID=2170551 RepID=A0A328AAQ2_9CAUL|nr:hypothetical protein [Phenylobacterium soli]RAK51833.1 hypothetical protein DJ017_18630 [Phenylobacterium soli]
MAEDAWTPREPFAPQGIEEPEDAGPRPGPGPGLGVAVAAIVAVLASAALAWWFAVPARAPHTFNAPPPRMTAPAEASPPLRYAPDDPDPNQVKRAWREVRQTYVDGGPEALMRASMRCARSLPAEPQLLDYCVAYDIYAADIVPKGADGAGDWFADAPGRDLALARTALPGVTDPSNRLAQLSALTKAVIPKPVAKTAAAKHHAARPMRHAQAKHAQAKHAQAKHAQAKHANAKHVKSKRRTHRHAVSPSLASSPSTAVYPYGDMRDRLEPPH